jgi:putative phosphoesterase
VRIALLSDIHANLPALEVAIAVASDVGAERLVVAGDLVGDGPYPAEVVARVRALGAECIRGNVDRQVVELAREDREKKLRKIARAGKGQKSNRAWAALRLRESREELEWLAALPAELRLDAGGAEILVVHGSPHGDTDYIYPSITPAALAGKLEPLTGGRPDVLVCGHSHVPFAREVDGVLVINCGTVGRPADGDPRGTLAVLEIDDGGARHARLVRFTYPVDAVVAGLEEREVPGIAGEEYRLGIKR